MYTCLFQFFFPWGVCWGYCWIIQQFYFQSFKKSYRLLWLYQFSFLHNSVSWLLFTLSPVFLVWEFGWWSLWQVWDDTSLSHYDNHLSDNEWCWACVLCSLAICICSLEKCLFSSFAHFLIELFIFLVLSSMGCLYMWEINSWAVVICSSYEGCLFTLLIFSFTVQKLRNLNQSLLFPSVFISITLGGGS